MVPGGDLGYNVAACSSCQSKDKWFNSRLNLYAFYSALILSIEGIFEDILKISTIMSLPNINYMFPSLDMFVSLLLVYSHGNNHGRNDGRQDILSLLHNFSAIYMCTVSKFWV